MSEHDDLISRQAAIDALEKAMCEDGFRSATGLVHKTTAYDVIRHLPSAQPEIAENLYLYKCYITDKDGLQHEVIHTGDIRRVTGWEI